MLDDEDDPRAKSLANLDDMVQGAWHRTAAHALLLKAKQDANLSGRMDGVSISGSGLRKGTRELAGPWSLQERLKMFDATGLSGRRGEAESGKAGKNEKTEAFAMADFPPSLRLVPCKPRLLDLAYDELEFPDLDQRAGIEKVEEVVEPQQTSGSTAGGGVRGWVGWALGRT